MAEDSAEMRDQVMGSLVQVMESSVPGEVGLHIREAESSQSWEAGKSHSVGESSSHERRKTRGERLTMQHCRSVCEIRGEWGPAMVMKRGEEPPEMKSS